jgi:hypothetical protein
VSFGRKPHRYDKSAEPETVWDALGAQLAHPKPRFVPQGEPVDKSSLEISLDSQKRDRGFLDLVRSELCAVYGEWASECAGVTEAAHLIVGGKGLKADDYLTVPLCSWHHVAQHNIGLVSFQIQYGINLWEVNSRLQARWQKRRVA